MVGDSALSLLWQGFDPWPSICHGCGLKGESPIIPHATLTHICHTSRHLRTPRGHLKGATLTPPAPGMESPSEADLSRLIRDPPLWRNALPTTVSKSSTGRLVILKSSTTLRDFVAMWETAGLFCLPRHASPSSQTHTQNKHCAWRQFGELV